MEAILAKRIALALSALMHMAVILLSPTLGVSESITAATQERPFESPLIATAIFMEQANVESASDAVRYATPPGQTLSIQLPLPPLPPIEAVATGAFDEGREPEDAEELRALERLQSIYAGQVDARIARVLELHGMQGWRAEGRCVIRVIQDEGGTVLDVDTHECTATARHDSRIVAVIRAASPLPLPPEGLARGSYLTLDLSSHGRLRAPGIILDQP